MLRFILIFIASTLLVGCFDAQDKTDSTVIEYKYHSFKVDTVYNNKMKLVSQSDTLSHIFALKKDFTYIIEIFSHGISPTGLSSTLFDETGSIFEDFLELPFKISTDTTLELRIYKNRPLSSAIEVTVFIQEFPPLSADFDGKWLLTEWKYSAFNKTSTYFFHQDSAHHMKEIKNDRVAHYNFREDTPVNINDAGLIFGSLTEDFTYRFSNDTLYLISKQNDRYERLAYKKYNGQLEEITWFQEKFKTNPNIIGTWFKTHWYEQEVVIEKNSATGEFEIVDSGTYEKSYTINNTSRAIEITSDSIVTYQNNNDGTFEVEVLNFENLRMPIFNNVTSTNDTFIDSSLYCDGEAYEFFGQLEVNEYYQYDGPMPPKEWQ